MATAPREAASESWARDLPAPLPEGEVRAACQALLTCPAGERREVLHRHGPEGRLQIVAALVEEGYRHRHSDPGRYLRIAQLASQCAYRYLCLPAPLRPAGRRLRAAARGFLANAYRISGCLPQAETLFAQLELLKEDVTNEVLVGHLLWFRGSLYRHRRQFESAIRAMTTAVEAFRRAGTTHLEAQAALAQAKCQEDFGELEAALGSLHRALGCIDGEAHPTLVVIALHNLTHLLTEMGRLEEALFVLSRVGWRYGEVDEPLHRLRGEGIKGRLLRELGAPREAAAVLEAVKDGLVERGLHYDAAVVSLELALAYARQYQSPAVMRLAQEMYPVFIAHDIPREASMALLEFVHAAEDCRAGSELIAGVLAKLKDLRRRPGEVPPTSQT